MIRKAIMMASVSRDGHLYLPDRQQPFLEIINQGKGLKTLEAGKNKSSCKALTCVIKGRKKMQELLHNLII